MKPKKVEWNQWYVDLEVFRFHYLQNLNSLRKNEPEKMCHFVGYGIFGGAGAGHLQQKQMYELAHQSGLSRTQVVIQWLYQHGVAALVKTTSFERMMEMRCTFREDKKLNARQLGFMMEVAWGHFQKAYRPYPSEID